MKSIPLLVNEEVRLESPPPHVTCSSGRLPAPFPGIRLFIHALNRIGGRHQLAGRSAFAFPACKFVIVILRHIVQPLTGSPGVRVSPSSTHRALLLIG